MAFSTPSFSTAEAAALAADKPMLVSPNRWLSTHSAQWRTSGSWASGSSAPDSSYPIERMFDDFSHLQSRPASAQTAWYLILDFGAAGINFDVIAILNHSLPTGLLVHAIVSDGNTYASSTSFGFVNATAGRRVVLMPATKFATVRYARIEFSGTSHRPQIGEIIFGARCQLDWRLDTPYDPDAVYTPNVGETETITGIMRSVARGNKSRSVVDGSSLIDSSTVQANLQAHFAEHGGLRPFLWIENPSTAPHRAKWVKLAEPKLELPYVDAGNRRFSIDAREMGPHFMKLEA